MFGISGSHLVVLAITLLLFGPKRLPQLGNTLGKAMKNFKDALAGVQEAQYRKVESAPEPTPTSMIQSINESTDQASDQTTDEPSTKTWPPSDSSTL